MGIIGCRNWRMHLVFIIMGALAMPFLLLKKKPQEDRELEMSVYNVVNKLRLQYQSSTDLITCNLNLCGNLATWLIAYALTH